MPERRLGRALKGNGDLIDGIPGIALADVSHEVLRNFDSSSKRIMSLKQQNVLAACRSSIPLRNFATQNS